MLPVLLDLKFIKIYTFGVFLTLAFFWGSFLLWRNIRLTSHKEEDIFDGLFISLFGGLFLGRLTYVILNFQEFGFNILKFVLINGYPGLSIIGAIAGAILTLYLFFSYKKMNFIDTIDYFITPLFIALSFGKLGSFFSGSEVGSETNFFLKIKYVGFAGMRHLTPFYEALLFALGSYISYRLLFEIRREKYRPGFLLVFFLWYFSLTYFVFDKLKETTLYLQGLSFNMVVSTALLLTTTFYFIYYKRRTLLEFLQKNGHKIFKKVHNGTKGKTSGGETKKPDAN